MPLSNATFKSIVSSPQLEGNLVKFKLDVKIVHLKRMVQSILI